MKQTYRYDSRLARKRRDIVRSLFGSVMVDVHPELQRAWHALILRGLPTESVAEFGRQPWLLTQPGLIAIRQFGNLPPFVFTKGHQQFPRRLQFMTRFAVNQPASTPRTG